MTQAARQGLRRILKKEPDDQDVHDVVLRAFRELLEMEKVRNPVSLGRKVAYRRGMDKAATIIRQQTRLRDNRRQIAQLRESPEAEEEALRREQLFLFMEGCLAELTSDQREVIEVTIMQSKSLSRWAMRRGVSYEAGRRMRARGLKALRRCINQKLADEGSEVL